MADEMADEMVDEMVDEIIYLSGRKARRNDGRNGVRKILFRERNILLHGRNTLFRERKKYDVYEIIYLPWKTHGRTNYEGEIEQK